jgi:hypothetical protein
VGLTADVELSLDDAGLIEFYDGEVGAFKVLATSAYSYAYGNVHATGLPLRRDDVAVNLVTALVINDDLRTCLAEKKLRQKFWYRRFADLILDRLWEELENEHQQAHRN